MIVTKNRDAKNPASCIVRVFGSLRFHTDGDLLCLAFIDDGSLVSLEEPGNLRRWQADGDQVEHHSLSDLETLWAFNNDGRFLASASDELSLWNVASGELVGSIPQPSWVTAMAFSVDARHLATGHDDGIVRLWELARGKLLHEFAGHEVPVGSVAFDPGGTHLASAGEDKVIALWEIATDNPPVRLAGHKDRIQTLLWHADGRRLICGGWDGSARVWDTATREVATLLNYHAGQVTALALTPDGRLLASGDTEGLIYVFDFDTGKPRGHLPGHRGPVSCLAFRRDGRALASGGADRLIRIWDPSQTEESPRIHYGRLSESIGFAEVSTSIGVSPNGRQLASASSTTLQLWNAESGIALAQSDQQSILRCLAFSPDGKSLAAGSEDASILLIDAASGQMRSALKDVDQLAPVTAVAFSHDGASLASASATGLEVWLWDLSQSEPRLLIPDAIGGCGIECLAFHPQDRWLAVGGIDWLATGGSDGAVSLWDVEERCEIATFDGGSKAIALHPSGQRLASASLARSICIWDIEARTLALELIGHEDTITCLAYSPDGRVLASGGDDRIVCLWDAASGKLLATAPLDTQIKALAFSPDGRFLYTGNANLTCYQVDTAVLLR